ncbi:hypothetical protein [Streptomyces avicenniae]|uniref:hypothetical protein n=1 Tax=Streptomyces avicenniae TaxID=500153 RepID=UPI00069978F0|nr:hypothetical protein [Streptomyces avicenniae]
MRRTGGGIAAVPLLAVLGLGLAGCGEEDGASGGGGGAVDADLVARAEALETSVDMVWVTETPGFTLAVQSAGPLNESGFQSSYVGEGGAVFRLTVDHAPEGAADDLCAVLTGGGNAFCATDGETWTVSPSDGAGEQRARLADGHLVTVIGDASVPPEVLDEALAAAHPADADELDAALPELTDPPPPVERGDLPDVGDGAPVDPVAPENTSG